MKKINLQFKETTEVISMGVIRHSIDLPFQLIILIAPSQMAQAII